MVLSPHIITGAALGANFQNIYLMPIAAMALHFFLDKIPHYDYEIEPFSFIVSAKVFADISISAITILIIYLFFNPNINPAYAIAGIFFSALPDGFLLASFIFKNKWLQKYRQFHNFFHWQNQKNPEKNPHTYFKKNMKLKNNTPEISVGVNGKEKKIPTFWNLSTQLTVIIIALYFLL